MSFEFSDDAMLVSFMLAFGFWGLTAVLSETLGGSPEPALYAPMMLGLIVILATVFGVLEWIWNLFTGDNEETEDQPDPAEYPATDGGDRGDDE